MLYAPTVLRIPSHSIKTSIIGIEIYAIWLIVMILLVMVWSCIWGNKK